MHCQADIPTISKTAPPSYAEAMAQVATKNNSYAAPYSQPTSTTMTTMYGQGCSQMPGYPSSAPANNFYSNIPNQSAYNQSYIPVESSQQCRPATTIVHVEPIARQNRLCCERKFTWISLDIDRYVTWSFKMRTDRHNRLNPLELCSTYIAWTCSDLLGLLRE